MPKPEGYVEVKDRIIAFYAEYPAGSLQSEIIELTDTRVTVKALAYRQAEDQRPGVGHSYMNIPGATNFTRGSELENAETSAWGRAIAALGFEVKEGIATRTEILNKQGEEQPQRSSGPAAPPAERVVSPVVGLTPKQIALVRATYGNHGVKDNAIVHAVNFSITGKRSAKEMTSADLDLVLKRLAEDDADELITVAVAATQNEKAA